MNETGTKPGLLSQLMAETPAAEPPSGNPDREQFEAWLTEHGVAFRSPKVDSRGRTIYALEKCVFNESHVSGSACIGLMPGGARFYKCHHNGCAKNRWAEFQQRVAPEPTKGTKCAAKVVRVADVEREDVSFLWDPYIPLGKLTLLEGDPSDGKTWVALALAARVSTGRGFKDADGIDAVREPANVLYLSAEDGIGDTLRPRLESMNADLNRISVLADGHVELSHTATVEKLIDDADNAKLIIVDPLQAYLGAKVDMHRANEVRPILSGLGQLAARRECAIVIVRHLAKSPNQTSAYRGMGSIDITAAARSVLRTHRARGSDARTMLHLKSSLARKGTSIGYVLDSAGFRFTGPSAFNEEDLSRSDGTKPMTSAAPGPNKTTAAAVEFLREMLKAGPVPLAEVNRRAHEAGVTERTLERARKALGVVAVWPTKESPGHKLALPPPSPPTGSATPAGSKGLGGSGGTAH